MDLRVLFHLLLRVLPVLPVNRADRDCPVLQVLPGGPAVPEVLAAPARLADLVGLLALRVRRILYRPFPLGFQAVLSNREGLLSREVPCDPYRLSIQVVPNLIIYSVLSIAKVKHTHRWSINSLCSW